MNSPDHSDEFGKVAPIPRISLQAFCETSELAQVINEASMDRRMDKAHVKVQMGGGAAAVEAYRSAPTPNLIVIETLADRSELIAHLEELAEFCDAGTRVVVIGRVNDIILYRDLMGRGVSEYLVGPVSVLEFIRSVSHLYAQDGADAIGRVIAFVGAKGGVGSSTVAHNVGWSIARDLEIETVIVDMDLAYGTAGLDFNQDPPQGIADAVFAPDRIDANMIDRLLSKCSDHLSLLAASATLDRVYDFDDTAFDAIFDILRSSVPCIIVDVPHVWTSWSKRVLTAADDVVVVASPDLANLRNAKSLLDVLRASRPNDHKPRLVMNNVGVLKRPEIGIAEFAKAVAQHLGTEHTELYLEPAEALALIPRLPEMYDEPFSDSSQLPTYLVAQLARQQVTVSLSGDAGDELFCGYPRYFDAVNVWERVSNVPNPIRRVAATGLGVMENVAELGAGQSDFLAKLKFHAGEWEQQLAAASPELIYHRLVSRWENPAAVVLKGQEPLTALTDQHQWAQVPSIPEQLMHVDAISYLPDDILVKVDRATMAVSLESRVPLLDHRIVEFAWRVPMSLKLREGKTKWLLRQVLYRYVPQELIERPKSGFAIPVAAWLRGPLRDWAESLLDEKRLREEGYFNAALVRAKWQEVLTDSQIGWRNAADQIWTVLMFQAWLTKS